MQPSHRARTSGGWRVRGTVVVAEDDPGLREVLLHVLHEAGYQVLLVSREADTLAALRRLGARCLLILEGKLPDGASEAILQAMASGPAPITCPVVLLSGPPVETRSPGVPRPQPRDHARLPEKETTRMAGEGDKLKGKIKEVAGAVTGDQKTES